MAWFRYHDKYDAAAARWEKNSLDLSVAEYIGNAAWQISQTSVKNYIP